MNLEDALIANLGSTKVKLEMMIVKSAQRTLIPMASLVPLNAVSVCNRFFCKTFIFPYMDLSNVCLI